MWPRFGSCSARWQCSPGGRRAASAPVRSLRGTFHEPPRRVPLRWWWRTGIARGDVAGQRRDRRSELFSPCPTGAGAGRFDSCHPRQKAGRYKGQRGNPRGTATDATSRTAHPPWRTSRSRRWRTSTGSTARGLHTELGDVPPAEHEADHDRQAPAPTTSGTRARGSTAPGGIRGRVQVGTVRFLALVLPAVCWVPR